MGEEKLIQVSFQIPSSALDSLTRLAEQLRLLTEAVGTQSVSGNRAAAENEYIESGSFDPERFFELQRNVQNPPAVRTTIQDIADAPAASSVISQTQNAEAVSAKVQNELDDAKSAWNESSLPPERSGETAKSDHSMRHISPEEGGDPPPPARDYLPDASAVQWNVEQQISDVMSVRAETGTKKLDLAAAQGDVTRGIEMPLGAGFVVQTKPEIPQNQWNNVAEELVISGPVPLTAEAVSLAFERDGRRYDNGFPLY